MGRVSGMEISSTLGISIPETQGPFGNCIPVGVNQAKFLFHMKFLLHFDKF
jgi:hypothetical protein